MIDCHGGAKDGVGVTISEHIGGWRRGRFAHTYAAIDLGTNNCRLLIARASATGFDVIDAFSRPVRLGEGIGDRERLCEQAIGRTMDALEVCAAKIQRAGVSRSRHIATEACRRAANGADFLSDVHDRVGLKLEIISPAEEARLALASCQSLIDPERPYALLVDIGGGSTEVVWVTVRTRPDLPCGLELGIIDMISIPWGVVTLTEGVLCGQSRERPLGEGVYEVMVGLIQNALKPFCAANSVHNRAKSGEVQMIGASGTVTTMAAHHLGLRRYSRAAVDGSSLARDTILRIGAELSRMSVRELTQVPCIGTDRADLALAGGAIFEAICRMWPVGSIRVADRGLREGVLVDLMREADRDADPLCARDDC